MSICKKWGVGLGAALQLSLQEGLGWGRGGMWRRKGWSSQEVSVLPVPRAGAAPWLWLCALLWVSAPTFSRGLNKGTIPVTSIDSSSHWSLTTALQWREKSRDFLCNLILPCWVALQKAFSVAETPSVLDRSDCESHLCTVVLKAVEWKWKISLVLSLSFFLSSCLWSRADLKTI